MLPREAGPGSMRHPFVRLFMRLDEIHKTVDERCAKCDERIPCDTMRALWIYQREAHPGVLS